MRWETFLLRLQRKGWSLICPPCPPADCVVCLLSNMMHSPIFFSPLCWPEEVVAEFLPVPPKRSLLAIHWQNPISAHRSYTNGPWTHRGPSVCSCVHVCACKCVCMYMCPLHLPASLCPGCVISEYYLVIDCWQATINWTQWSCSCPADSPTFPTTHTHTLTHNPHVKTG